MIVSVAIRVKNVTSSGCFKSHAELMRAYPELVEGKRGFVDEHGRFYTRSEALNEAVACGQVRREDVPAGELCSYHLWG